MVLLDEIRAGDSANDLRPGSVRSADDRSAHAAAPLVRVEIFKTDDARLKRPKRFRWTMPAAASALLHLSALYAAMTLPWPDRNEWRLVFQQGRNSAPLEASVAATPSAPSPRDSVRMPQREVRSELDGRAETFATVAQQAVEALRVRPPGTQPIEHAAPLPRKLEQIARRTDSESPTAIETPSPRKPTEKRRPTPTTSIDVIQVDVAAVASAQSAASAGVEDPVVPAAVVSVTPLYPPQSAALGEQGTTWLWVRVDREGAVVATGVHQSSGYERLDQAALAAMRRFRFTSPGEARTSAEFLWDFRFQLPPRNTPRRR